MTFEGNNSSRRNRLPSAVLIGVLFLVCFACLLPEFILAAIQIAGHCIAGAIRYTARAAEQIQSDRIGATVSLVAFVALIFGTQFAATRFKPSFPWSMDHSIRAVLGVVCIVATGICVTSFANTLIWDATTTAPWFRISLTRDANYRTISSNQLKQIGVALHQYHDGFQSFPIGGTFQSNGTAGHGWLAELLPFINQTSVYNQIRFDLPWYHRINRDAYETRIPLFEDPVIHPKPLPTREYAPAYFAANDQVFNANRGLSISDFTDGAGNTILAGSIKDRPRAWGDAANWRKLEFGINKSIDGFGSFEPGGTFFLMADGSVRFINEDTDLRTLRAMATPNADDTVWEY